MMNNKGFTLIELVVVIVILGILAVTAVPKYINLQADAKTATLEGVKASLQGAAALVHVKSLVKGNQNETFNPITNTISLGDGLGFLSNGELALIYGYPLGSISEFKRLIDIDTDKYAYAPIGGGFTTFVIYFKEENVAPISTSEDCIVIYTQSSGVNQRPTIKVNDCI
jgi:MSHA pilin protein MshA